MATILNIETSTHLCSVALTEEGGVLFEKSSAEGPNHARLLGLFVSEAVEFARQSGRAIDAVAVSAGPGSYTGLRIGVSLAKGFAYGAGIPLIAVDTLKIMAQSLIECCELGEDDLLSPMIDARRMEVYQAIFDNRLNVIKETSADVIDVNSYLDYLAERIVWFFGDGSTKCRETITHANAKFAEIETPLARHMAKLSDRAYTEKAFVDIAYFEPFYLKEFIGTIAKNKVIQ